MSTVVSDYVARINVACVSENDIVVVLKFDKKDQALEKILKKATLKNKIDNVFYDLEYDQYSFRIYFIKGQIVFRDIKNIQTTNRLLEDLLL
jgi:hypothetical protein